MVVLADDELIAVVTSVVSVELLAKDGPGITVVSDGGMPHCGRCPSSSVE